MPNTSASAEDKHQKDLAYQRAYYAKHRDKFRAKNREYYYKNLDYFNAKHKRWRSENPTHDREYYLANKEHILAGNRRRHKENPELAHQAYLRWRDKDPENYRAIRRKAAKKWYHANPEKVAEMRDRWVEENYEQYLADARTRSRKWAKDNPDAAKAKVHRRRARKVSVGGSWTAEQWQALKAEYGNECLACNRSEELLVSLGLTLTPDHVLPLEKLGSNDISNIQPLCHGRGGCNNKKHTKHIDYRKNVGK